MLCYSACLLKKFRGTWWDKGCESLGLEASKQAGKKMFYRVFPSQNLISALLVLYILVSTNRLLPCVLNVLSWKNCFFFCKDSLKHNFRGSSLSATYISCITRKAEFITYRRSYWMIMGVRRGGEKRAFDPPGNWD